MKKMLAVISAVCFIVGCIPSLHPLYTENDLIFEKSLVGTWVDENPENTWTFSHSGEKEYKLICTEDGKPGEFSAHLLKIKNKMFIDLYPAEPELKTDNGFYKAHLIPADTFMLVKQIEPTLQMAFLNPNKLKEIIAKDPKAVKHEKLGKDDDRDIFTASPAELQDFIMKNIDTPDFFLDPSNLKRQSKTASDKNMPEDKAKENK
ncbi:MAG: hypothetical protein WC637_17285 [Victivallales bacterium]|jgi:hypothetical protein